MSYTTDFTNLDNAVEIIAAYRGLLRQEIAQEAVRNEPNRERIAALESEVSHLRAERLSLNIGNRELVNKVRFVYGPIVAQRTGHG